LNGRGEGGHHKSGGHSYGATSKKFDEECDKAERVRGVIFVDSLACAGGGFI
jgi:hypothetical protein